jgi:hypothetical protein
MDTFFASANRLGDDQLKKEMDFVARNSIIDALLHSVSGLLAVLNEERQILVINDELLAMLGADNAREVLGMRPGEALKCSHATEMPGGCGTSTYCSTCGAAIAIVTSMTMNSPMEKECAITSGNAQKKRDLFFRVRCVPVTYEGRRLLLLFMQDITYQQKLATLEKLFFHDINGIISGLVNAGYLLSIKSGQDAIELAQMISKLSMRLAAEVSIQQCLNEPSGSIHKPIYSSVSMRQLFREIKDLFSNHPAAQDKLLIMPEECPDLSFNTEFSLLMRILRNMITNAFEETSKGDEVRVWYESAEESLTFYVWNRKHIPADIAKRLFQRNFSTKAKMGRGLGTYSMKMLGEDILGGIVDFTTAEDEGTVFRFQLKNCVTSGAKLK